MKRYVDLDKAINAERSKRLTYVKECEAAFELSREWLIKYSAEHEDDIRKALVSGSFSAAVEVVSLTYLGLLRSAIFSLRTHYDLAYGWLYYRDHPVEWRAVVAGTEQARLPGAIDQYLSKYYQQYDKRWTELEKKRNRKIKDPYAHMSIFIHGGHPDKMPTANRPADIVLPANVVGQLPPFVKDVSEVLSDVFISCHGGNWQSIPERIRVSLDQRFGGKARSSLLFD